MPKYAFITPLYDYYSSVFQAQWKKQKQENKLIYGSIYFIHCMYVQHPDSHT